MTKKFYNIKYIPTGNIFNLAKEEVDRLVIDEPHNFEVVDKDYQKPAEAIEAVEPTVFEQVVEEEPKESEAGIAEQVVEEKEIKDIDDMKIDELREYCKENNIDIKGIRTKAEILEKIKG